MQQLYFQEYEWSLDFEMQMPGDTPEPFIKPILANVSNLGHPLFALLEVPHIIVEIEKLISDVPYTKTFPLDASAFQCTAIELRSTTKNIGNTLLGNARNGPARVLATTIDQTIYGHNSNNDLSDWGSEFIRISYRLKDDVAETHLGLNGKIPYDLLVEVLFQFGPYSNSPSHEPSGILNASRLTPAISFSTNSPALKRLRADVRCDLRIDSLSNESEYDGYSSLAGIFSDDDLPLSLSAAIRAGKVVLDRPNSLAEVAATAPFLAAEKPLLYEVCSVGNDINRTSIVSDVGAASELKAVATYNPSVSYSSKTTQLVWDNLHLWPGKLLGKDFIPMLPSTPGAFYALHTHWRWSAFVSDYYYAFNNGAFLHFLLAMPPYNITPQLKYHFFMRHYFGAILPGVDKGQWHYENVNIGGTLIDPNLSDQTIAFAVVRTRNSYLASEEIFDFTKHFLSRKAEKPDAIEQGAELSFWMSFAPERKFPHDDFGGTLFANGMYFAHSIHEPASILDSLTAASIGQPAYFPPGRDDVPYKWIRPPRG